MRETGSSQQEKPAGQTCCSGCAPTSSVACSSPARSFGSKGCARCTPSASQRCGKRCRVSWLKGWWSRRISAALWSHRSRLKTSMTSPTSAYLSSANASPLPSSMVTTIGKPTSSARSIGWTVSRAASAPITIFQQSGPNFTATSFFARRRLRLAQSAGNPPEAVQRAHRYRRMSSQFRPQWRAKDVEHKTILDSVIARDTAKAQELIERHIRETTENVIKHAGHLFCRSGRRTSQPG